MVSVDHQKCIGCGKCIRDCVGNALKLEDRKAIVKKDCILCGHCAAICPMGAVTITEYADDPMIPYEKEAFDLDPEIFLNAVKFRRSIRNFKEKKIEKEKLLKLIETASHTASAKNERKMKIVVVQDRLDELKEMVFEGIGEELKKKKEERSPEAALLYGFYKGRTREPEKEFLFRNAPAVLYLLGERMDDAGLAAQNIEMMAQALGLGVLYDGYLKAATMYSERAGKFLDPDGRPVAVCMLIGYPAVSYRRTAPRKLMEYEIL